MAKIASNWKITFDPDGSPVVLVNVGDIIDGELRFPMKRGLEVVEITDGDAPFLRPTRNIATTLDISVEEIALTDKDARVALMGSLTSVEGLGKKPLKIEVSGITDRHWEFANSYIENVTPERLVESAKPRILKTYQITATGLVLYIQLTAGDTHSEITYAPNQIVNTHTAL